MQRRRWMQIGVAMLGLAAGAPALGQGTLTLVAAVRGTQTPGRLCDVELTGPGFRWDVRVENPSTGRYEEVDAINDSGPQSPVRLMAAVTGQGAAVIRTVTIPFLAPGSPARVQARVWDFTTGNTFDTARIRGTQTFEVRALGGVGQPPTLPARLEMNRGTYAGNCWDAPVIRSIPGDQVRHAGESFGLTVTPAEANAATRYQWRRNGVALTNGLEATLPFPAVSPADAGVYEAVVSVGGRTVTSRPVRLDVQGPPRLEAASAGGEPLRLRLLAATNRWYALEQARSGGPRADSWEVWTNVPASQATLEVTVPAEAVKSGIFRVRVIPAP